MPKLAARRHLAAKGSTASAATANKKQETRKLTPCVLMTYNQSHRRGTPQERSGLTAVRHQTSSMPRKTSSVRHSHFGKRHGASTLPHPQMLKRTFIQNPERSPRPKRSKLLITRLSKFAAGGA